jgi:outer membrane protein OmpA-like peptidoglycan-associated protein
MRRRIVVASLVALSGILAAPLPARARAKAYPVFFQPWSAAISDTAAQTIKTAARAALADPAAPVRVTGSADTVGSRLANKYMSETRAQVVSDALVADGVAAQRIRIDALGATLGPGTAPQSYDQFSRRVVIDVGK